uniref:Neuropeptide FF receptor 1 like 1 n=1 Tax=Cyprinus carpio TaxID=7962 RepID=A0A8C2FP99_CYPCA
MLLPYYICSGWCYILSYLLVLLLCVMGNGLVCLVVIKNRHMRSAIDLFILNLAISDLLVGIFCVPTTLIDSLISGWPFSQITCTMINMIQAVDRATWLRTVPISVILETLQYLPLLGLISILYTCIATKLSNNLHENRVRSKRRMKVIKMLIMVAILLVSWLQLWALMLLTLAFFNCGVSLIIYGFFNENNTVACDSCRSFMLEMHHTHTFFSHLLSEFSLRTRTEL